MDISNIKLSGIQRKSEKQDKVKNQTSSIETKELTPQERSVLEKIRSKALASYLAAAMAVGGASSMMTSCVEQEVNVNDDELKSMITQMIQLQQEMIKLMQENNADNKEQIEQNKQIMNILLNIQSGVMDIKDGVTSITILLEGSNQFDVEFIEKLNEIINNQTDSNKALQEILELNRQQTLSLQNIETLIETIGGTDSKLAEILEKFYNDFKESDKTHTENENTHTNLMNQILAAIQESNSISASTLTEIQKFHEDFLAGKITEAEMWEKITGLLESIDAKLDGLLDAVKGLESSMGDLVNGSGEKIVDILNNLLQKFEDHSITSNALAAEILEELKTSNINDEKTLAKLDQIYQELQNGNINASEALTQITDILNQIKENTDAIKDAVLKISADIVKYGDAITNKQDQQLDILGNLNNNVSNIGSDIKELIELQKQNNQNLVNIANSIDEMNVKLDQIKENQGDQLTIDQIKELAGPAFNQLMEILGDIHGSQISIDDVKDALEQYKTDLTKTNSLIETLTTVVQNLSLGSGMSEQLKEVVQKLEDLKNIQSTGNANIIEDLEGIQQEIAGVKGILDALLQTANNIKANQDTYMAGAKTFGTKLFEELEKLQNNMLDKDAFNVYAESYKEQLVQAEKTRQEQKVILQTILENMGKSQSGVDVDELIAKLPNYTDILNEISEKLGKVITSSDLENFFVKTQPDLTKTNNLIETLTTVVQNLNISGGSSSGVSNQVMEAIKTTVNQILTAINNGQIASEQQIQSLLDSLSKIEENTKPSTDTNTRLAASFVDTRSGNKGTTYVHPGWIYAHSFNA